MMNPTTLISSAQKASTEHTRLEIDNNRLSAGNSLKQNRQHWLGDLLVVLVGAAAMAATYPGRTHGLGMVTEPLLKDFQLSTDDGRIIYSSINFWATIVGAFFCFPIGWLFDRYDRRSILAINLFLLGSAVAWMSIASDLWTLAIAITLTRGFGQSALSVVSLSIVAKHFPVERLGVAMAWYAVLSAPFHLALINSVSWAFAIEGASWRSIWAGIGIALVALSFTALLLPKAVTKTDSMANQSEPKDSLSSGFTLREALMTPAFWTFSLTISVWGMIYAGVALFNEDIFKERGFDRTLYFRVLSEVTIIAIASKFLFGWLVNYLPLNRLLAICLLATSCSLAGFTKATAVWHVYAYGFGLGIASGAVALLFFATWGKLFGRRCLGQIQGVAQMLTVFASAVGPLIFTVGKRATSSYSTIFLGLGGIVFLMAIASILTPLPKHRVSTSD